MQIYSKRLNKFFCFLIKNLGMNTDIKKTLVGKIKDFL